MLQKFSVDIQCILNVLHQLVVSNLIYLTLGFKIDDNSDYTLSPLNGPLLSCVASSTLPYTLLLPCELRAWRVQLRPQLALSPRVPCCYSGNACPLILLSFYYQSTFTCFRQSSDVPYSRERKDCFLFYNPALILIKT